MSINIIEVDPLDLREMLKLAVPPGVKDNPSKQILQQVGLCTFYGARCWVATEMDLLVSFNMTKFGKRKKNVWEPYANWYLAYTVPSYRRQGYARDLGLHVRERALEAGCRRIRSLAGSWAGAALHASMGDWFWGLTPDLEAVVDSPLDLTVNYPTNVLPGSVRNALKGEPEFFFPAMSLDYLLLELGRPQLNYDLGKPGSELL